MKKKVLVVVAHPDDETIWMGGTILQNKNNWDTTIISLCRKNDSDRAPKFKKVCQKLNAKGFMSNLDDSEDEYYKKISTEDIITRIQQFAEKNYDLIFTHGSNGEYGHIRHVETNKAVKEMLQKNLITVGKIFFFAYKKSGAYCSPQSGVDKVINLNNLIFSIKKDIIQRIYGFKAGSFEERCCKATEAFTTDKKI
jgi:LmbE family N-acetylglucosaminyl deacetylase